MKIGDLGRLFLLAAIWGGSFLFIRVASPVLGPILLTSCRVLLAGSALWLYARLSRQPLELRSHWRQFLILGTVNAALPFGLIAFAELNLTAAFGSILNATTPLFTALVAAVVLKDSLTPRKIAGLLLGMAGVAVVVGWSAIEINLTVIIAVAASLAAALFYGLGAVYSRVGLKGTLPITLATGQQLGAATVLFLPGAASVGSASAPSSGVILCVLGLALVSTSFAYLIYFRLMQSVGPTRTTSVTFLVPVFAIVWDALFLGEPIGLGLIAGFGIILSGLVLVMNVQWRPTRPAPEPKMLEEIRSRS